MKFKELVNHVHVVGDAKASNVLTETRTVSHPK